jgi:hypothetical protein
MKTCLTHASRVAAMALAILASSPAIAQGGGGWRMVCNNIGGSFAEPVAEGRALQQVTFGCRVENGTMAEGVMSGSQTYELKGPNGTVLSGDGIVRSPRGTLVYRNTEGTITLQMSEGKVVGATSEGKGVYAAAYGAAGPLAGKS